MNAADPTQQLVQLMHRQLTRSLEHQMQRQGREPGRWSEQFAAATRRHEVSTSTYLGVEPRISGHPEPQATNTDTSATMAAGHGADLHESGFATGVTTTPPSGQSISVMADMTADPVTRPGNIAASSDAGSDLGFMSVSPGGRAVAGSATPARASRSEAVHLARDSAKSLPAEPLGPPLTVRIKPETIQSVGQQIASEPLPSVDLVVQTEALHGAAGVDRPAENGSSAPLQVRVHDGVAEVVILDPYFLQHGHEPLLRRLQDALRSQSIELDRLVVNGELRYRRDEAPRPQPNEPFLVA